MGGGAVLYLGILTTVWPRLAFWEGDKMKKTR
jgi:hypothetical protein